MHCFGVPASFFVELAFSEGNEGASVSATASPLIPRSAADPTGVQYSKHETHSYYRLLYVSGFGSWAPCGKEASVTKSRVERSSSRRRGLHYPPTWELRQTFAKFSVVFSNLRDIWEIRSSSWGKTWFHFKEILRDWSIPNKLSASWLVAKEEVNFEDKIEEERRRKRKGSGLALRFLGIYCSSHRRTNQLSSIDRRNRYEAVSR